MADAHNAPGAKGKGRGRKDARTSRARTAEDAAAYDQEPLSAADAAKRIAELEKAMFKAAENLEFEEAASIRDRIHRIKAQGFAA